MKGEIKMFERAELNIIKLNVNDIITASPGDGGSGDITPPTPED